MRVIAHGLTSAGAQVGLQVDAAGRLVLSGPQIERVHFARGSSLAIARAQAAPGDQVIDYAVAQSATVLADGRAVTTIGTTCHVGGTPANLVNLDDPSSFQLDVVSLVSPQSVPGFPAGPLTLGVTGLVSNDWITVHLLTAFT